MAQKSIEELLQTEHYTHITIASIINNRRKQVKRYDLEDEPTEGQILADIAEVNVKCIVTAMCKDKHLDSVVVQPDTSDNDRLNTIINGYRELAEVQAGMANKAFSETSAVIREAKGLMEMNTKMACAMETTYQKRLELDAIANERRIKELEKESETDVGNALKFAAMEREIEDAKNSKDLIPMLIEKAIENPEAAKNVLSGVIEVGYNIYEKIAHKGLKP